jgi:hypothetical protein
MLLCEARSIDQGRKGEVWSQKHHLSQLYHFRAWYRTQRGQSVLNPEHERTQGHSPDQGISRLLLSAAQPLHKGLRHHSQAYSQHNEEGSQLSPSSDRRVRSTTT